MPYILNRNCGNKKKGCHHGQTLKKRNMSLVIVHKAPAV